MDNYIGIDIGGTKVAVILGSDDSGTLKVLEREAFPTADGNGYKGVIEKICDLISAMMRRHELSENDIIAAGISCGGPLDSKAGEILSPPNLIGWDKVPIVRLLQETFDFPFFLQNDANASALAEWRYGAGRGSRNMIFLTFGTGLGAGLILNGHLYSGTNDMAGEVGHVRLSEVGPVGYGKAGSFEGYCSGGGIVQLAQMRVLEQLQQGKKPSLCPSADQMGSLTTKCIALAASTGDSFAKEIIEESATRLGYGLSMLIDILNPEKIVIGSIYARAESLFRERMTEIIRREALATSADVCRIVPAELGDALGDYAALSVAVDGWKGSQRT